MLNMCVCFECKTQLTFSAPMSDTLACVIMQVLGSIRSQLGAVVQERSRVTELICHSVGSAYYFARTEALSNSRGRHTKTLSAPPVFLGKGEELTVDQDTGNSVCVLACVCACALHPDGSKWISLPPPNTTHTNKPQRNFRRKHHLPKSAN